MLIKKYRFMGGKHSETASIKNILFNLGIESKFDNQPYTEEFLLGVGGGIRNSYFIFELKSGPFLAIGARHLLESNNFIQDVCRRLKIPAILKESTSKKLAFNDLISSLDEGFPVLAWVDLASLPYYHYPEEMIKYFIHIVAITGFDEKNNKFIIDDRSKFPIKLAADVLSNSRCAISSLKNRLLVPRPPLHNPSLKNAITDGIKQCCDGMLHPKLKNFGLESLKEWAQALLSDNQRHSWRNIFRDSGDLYLALVNVFFFIEGATDGSALRKMYSDFLFYSNGILSQNYLMESAGQFKEISEIWNTLANTALDDSVPLFHETKELLRRRNNLYHEQGQKANSEIKKTMARIFQIKREVSKEFPLNSGGILDLLNEMNKQVLNIYNKEKTAIEILNKNTT